MEQKTKKSTTAAHDNSFYSLSASSSSAKTKKYCGHCGRTLKTSEFYTSNNKERYPDGFLKECKKCATMHLNIYDSYTITPLLQEIDVPWLPEEWNNCLDQVMAANANDPSLISAQSVLGRYVAHMRLVQYRYYRYKDTESLQQKLDDETRKALLSEHYSEEEIEEKLSSAKTITANGTSNADGTPITSSSVPPSAACGTYSENDLYAKKIEQEKYFSDQLTDEDKSSLLLKWGPEYTCQQWIQLEQLYEDMTHSYDIQSAGHRDTLKLVCKASLKTHELLNMGDMDGALKASRMYDTLMKSGKFQALQNKTDSGNAIDSIGELVALCESDGYIEKYYISSPKDKVDQVLDDYKEYVRYLIETEENLGSLIESSAKILAQQEQDNALAAEDDDDSTSSDVSSTFNNDDSTSIDDSDIESLLSKTRPKAKEVSPNAAG